MNVSLVTHVIAVHRVRIRTDHMYVPVTEATPATGTPVEMWMSVHSAVLIAMPMHNAATFPDLTLANAITRMVTMATELNATPTEASRIR